MFGAWTPVERPGMRQRPTPVGTEIQRAVLRLVQQSGGIG